ncbi:1523_t:CDS:2, partial [Ambispora leptoticha]
LDGWIIPTMESIYNYLVTTDIRKEYLISLRDYSDQSYMSEFLANEISDIIEQLSSEKFAAICATHAINLIAADLVQLESVKKLINNCGRINHFFKTSYSSHSLLTKGFVNMKIKNDELKTWVKTY